MDTTEMMPWTKRALDFVVVHHSAGWFGNLDYINDLHKARNFPVSKAGNSCGYHLLVLNGYGTFEDLDQKKYRPDIDGKVVRAREDSENGAHVHGLNDRSLGICAIGKFEHLLPSLRQLQSLVSEIVSWCKAYNLKVENILGHNEAQALPGKSFVPANDRKTCPGNAIDMSWVRGCVWRELQRI